MTKLVKVHWTEEVSYSYTFEVPDKWTIEHGDPDEPADPNGDGEYNAAALALILDLTELDDAFDGVLDRSVGDVAFLAWPS